MTSHSDDTSTDNDRAAVANTVATTDDSISNGAIATAGNGKVPSATPTDMFSLDSRVRGNDGAVVVGGGDGIGNGAAVVATVGAGDGNGAVGVGTVGGGVGDGATDGAVTDAADTVIDDAVAVVGAVKKRNFHTGLDPVSGINNSVKPTELTVTPTPLINVRCARLVFLDTGLNPVWSVVDGGGGGGGVGDGVVGVATVGDGVGDGAVVGGTVGTVGDGVGDGAVGVSTVTVIDGAVAVVGTVKKRNFHTGLEPVSRTNMPAKPTELNKVRYARLFFLDTGLNPVWSVVVGGGDGVGGGAVVTMQVTVTTVLAATVTMTTVTVTTAMVPAATVPVVTVPMPMPVATVTATTVGGGACHRRRLRNARRG